MAVEKTVLLPVTPDEAFALVTEPERLRRWLTVSARVDLRAGGAFRWMLTPMAVASGTVTEVEPGRRVVLDFGWEHVDDPARDTVILTIEPVEGGTLVRLLHDAATENNDEGHGDGWAHFLERLQRAAVTGDAGPDEWVAAPAVLDPLTSASACLAALQHVLRGLGDADLTRPTPCRDFTVADLERHLLGSLVSLTGLAGGELTPSDAVTLEARLADAGQHAVQTWRERGLDGTVLAGGQDAPAPGIAGILSIEFLVHAWDFATATGRKVEVSDEVAGYVLDLAHQIVTDELRASAGFDPAVPVSDDAGPLERLLAHTGRVV